MRTKDISGIMAKGTPRQRLNLLYSHFALLQFNKKGILTESEIAKITQSFKTSQEIDLYNKYIAIDNSVRHSLLYLNQVRLGYREQIAYINGYSLLWHSLERATDLFNELLYDVKDKKLKDRLTKKILDREVAPFNKFITDKEGYIKLKPKEAMAGLIDGSDSGVESFLQQHKKNAEEMLVIAKTYLKALKDFIEEKSFNIDEYKYQIKIIETDLEEDKSIIPKYSRKKLKEALGELGDPEDKTEKLFSRYFVYPDYDSIEIDEAQYKNYRENHLYEK